MKRIPKDVDGKNGDRAQFAQEAFWAYLNGTPPFCIDRAVGAWQKITKSDDEDVLTDLLCDIHHWCDRNPVDFKKAVEMAKGKREITCDVAAFLRELREWGKKRGFSYTKGLQKAKYHYEAETGVIPY